jgi:hypothetical protein
MVGHGQDGPFSPGVDPETVRSLELSVARSRLADLVEKFFPAASSVIRGSSRNRRGRKNQRWEVLFARRNLETGSLPASAFERSLYGLPDVPGGAGTVFLLGISLRLSPERGSAWHA